MKTCVSAGIGVVALGAATWLHDGRTPEARRTPGPTEPTGPGRGPCRKARDHAPGARPTPPAPSSRRAASTSFRRGWWRN